MPLEVSDGTGIFAGLSRPQSRAGVNEPRLQPIRARRPFPVRRSFWGKGAKEGGRASLPIHGRHASVHAPPRSASHRLLCSKSGIARSARAQNAGV